VVLEDTHDMMKPERKPEAETALSCEPLSPAADNRKQ
jgi:hypothetical protein